MELFKSAILKIAPEVGNLPLGIRIVGLQPCLHQLHSLANHSCIQPSQCAVLHRDLIHLLLLVGKGEVKAIFPLKEALPHLSHDPFNSDVIISLEITNLSTRQSISAAVGSGR